LPDQEQLILKRSVTCLLATSIETAAENTHEDYLYALQLVAHVSTCRKLFPEFFVRIDRQNEQALAEISNLAEVYREACLWKEVQALVGPVLEARTKLLGKEHLNTLTSMNAYVEACHQQGRYMEAGSLAVFVINARTQLLSPDHKDTLWAMSNLALAYMADGRWEETEYIEKQVFERSVKSL
jgi:hypothetical protein